MKMKKHWPVTSLDAQELTDLGLPHGRVTRPMTRARRGFVGTVYNTLRMSQNLLRFLVDLNAAYADDSLRPIPCNSSAFKACLAVNPEHIKSMYGDHHQFKSARSFVRPLQASLGFSLVTVGEEGWAPMRSRTARYFRPEALQQYGDAVVDVVESVTLPALREKARRGLDIDVFDEMLDVASIIAFKSFLGEAGSAVPTDVYQTLNDVFCWIRENMFSVFIIPVWLPTRQNIRLRKNLTLLNEYIRPKLFIAAEQQTMFGDIIRAHTDKDGRLNERLAFEETISNLVGGPETTIILLAWVLYYVVQNPNVEKRILSEIRSTLGDSRPTVRALKTMPYLDAVVRETLRLRSPAYVQSRVAVVDTELDGFKVDKGTVIFACQYITHLDPRFWKNPTQFDPERFLSGEKQSVSGTAYFPFGGGKQICIGMNYAVNEAKLVTILLLRSFRFGPRDARALAKVGVDARTTARPDRPIELRVELRKEHHGQTTTAQVGRQQLD